MLKNIKNVNISLNEELSDLYKTLNITPSQSSLEVFVTFTINDMEYLVEYSKDSAGILEYEVVSHRKNGYCPLCQKKYQDGVYDDICYGIDLNEDFQKEIFEHVFQLLMT